MHRDIMAGHNICNAIKGHHNQDRPDYLQPVNANGQFPWKQDKGSNQGYGRKGGVKRKAGAEGAQSSQSNKRVALA